MSDTLWRCTVCGREGSVGRCCGLETREPINDAARAERNAGGTPRTNAARCVVPENARHDYVHVDFARVLKRDLNAANERVATLNAKATGLRNTLQRERVVNRMFKNANERHLREAEERVAALEQIIQRARVRFCGNGSDGTTCADMRRILDQVEDGRL